MLAFWRVTAQIYTGREDPRLSTAFTLDVPSTGVSISHSGRTFLVLARVDGSTGAQIVEYDTHSSTMTPYPNEEWNSYEAGKDPSKHCVRINSQRIGPDGYLYLVDVGSPGFGDPVIFPYGPKLISIDLATNLVSRIYYLGNATRSTSLIDDVRFNPLTGKAYLTDAGEPGLLVLDLESGISRRVLNAAVSTKAHTPISAEGRYLITAGSGAFQYVHADQLEVSPDSKWLYFQPASGGMSRIETVLLEKAFYNSSMSEDVLSSFITPFALTPSTGGTAIDANGVIYSSDFDSQRILAISPDGTKTVLVQDPRLLWVDAMVCNKHEHVTNAYSAITDAVHIDSGLIDKDYYGCLRPNSIEEHHLVTV